PGNRRAGEVHDSAGIVDDRGPRTCFTIWHPPHGLRAPCRLSSVAASGEDNSLVALGFKSANERRSQKTRTAGDHHLHGRIIRWSSFISHEALGGRLWPKELSITQRSLQR